MMKNGTDMESSPVDVSLWTGRLPSVNLHTCLYSIHRGGPLTGDRNIRLFGTGNCSKYCPHSLFTIVGLVVQWYHSELLAGVRSTGMSDEHIMLAHRHSLRIITEFAMQTQ
ncbi:hypothetical protein A1F94_001578 [Pyrenophora tritici-repentis]|nr:hypothetical protein A1F99_021850 [Pyrenophora tritici-repentis]KAG9388685.1 hypothetical protein A1F94_001578 [Pyrenophora tritici-repentis]